MVDKSNVVIRSSKVEEECRELTGRERFKRGVRGKEREVQGSEKKGEAKAERSIREDRAERKGKREKRDKKEVWRVRQQLRRRSFKEWTWETWLSLWEREKFRMMI